eukprot:COSAG02_NODE_20966_length_808_cov_0.772920_1_plen_231_part_00
MFLRRAAWGYCLIQRPVLDFPGAAGAGHGLQAQRSIRPRSLRAGVCAFVAWSARARDTAAGSEGCCAALMPPRRSSEESPRRRGDADEASQLPEEEQAGGGLFSQAMQMANDAIKQVEAGEDEPQKESPVADDLNDSSGGFMGRFSAPTELPADLDATISTVGVVTDGNHPHRAQKSLSERNHSDHVQALLESVAGSAPPRLAKVVHALGPVVAKLTTLLDTAGPPALVF